MNLVTIGEHSVIPDGVKIGKNTAISGVTEPEDYPDGELASEKLHNKGRWHKMRAIGIVLAGGNSKRMRELSNKRAIAAMPVANCEHRFCAEQHDQFPHSECGRITEYNSRSLNLHLRFF